MNASIDCLDETVPPTLWNVEPEALPRCFILNEKHRVILVCSPKPGDPLHGRFIPAPNDNALPPLIERAVRILEDACGGDPRMDQTSTLGSIRLRVRPLHGAWGSHTSVIVEQAQARRS